MGRILVVRLSSMGDIILTQPAIAAAHKAGYAVDLAVLPDYVALGRMLPGVDRVICSRVEFAKTYDWVIDLHATLKARRFLKHVRTGHLIRYSKRSIDRRLLLRPKGKPAFWNKLSALKKDEQVMRWYGEAMAKAGISPSDKFPELNLSEWAHHAADQTLEKAGIKPKDRMVVLAPGAKWAAKQWPLDRFVQTAVRLQTENKMVPIFIGSMKERRLCEQAANETGGRAASIAGLTNIPSLAAVCSRAEVMIANDSGPMHLGLAAGTYGIALFGPTVGAFGFAPYRHPRAVVLEKEMACRPCSLHGGTACPLKHHQCLRGISVDKVCQTVTEYLETNPRKRRKAD